MFKKVSTSKIPSEDVQTAYALVERSSGKTLGYVARIMRPGGVIEIESDWYGFTVDLKKVDGTKSNRRDVTSLLLLEKAGT